MLAEQFPIPEVLRGVVQNIWVLQGNEFQNKTFNLFADGCPGLIFQHPDDGSFSLSEKQLPEAFIYGASTRFSSLKLKGRFNMLGVFFKPQAIKTLFRIDANELTDSCLDIEHLEVLHPILSKDQLLQAQTVQERVNTLTHFLVQLYTKNPPLTTPLIEATLEKVMQDHASFSLTKLAKELNVSERTIQRLFLSNIGIPPKLFARIYHFQTTLHQLRSKDYDKLSDIAFDAFYADQSHFIRNFKEFSGLLPYQYTTKGVDWVHNLSEIKVG